VYSLKGQLTLEYLISFFIFLSLVIYVYYALSSNIPNFVGKIEKENIRSENYQLSELLINDDGEPWNWDEANVERIGLFDNTTTFYIVENDLENNLWGYWKFNEGSGNIAHDSSGNGINGIINGNPIWVDGNFGKALNFDGNDYVSIPSIKITNAITICAWVKIRGWSNYPGIVSEGYATTGGYSIHVRGDYSIWFELDENSGARHYYNPKDTTLTLGEWSFVVATYDGLTQRIYINNEEVGSGLSGTFAIGTVADSVEIGHLPGWGYFNGVIDEVRIYNKALDESEIEDLYTYNILYYAYNISKLNTVSKLKIEELGAICDNSFDDVQDKIGLERPFSIKINYINDDGSRTEALDCGQGTISAQKIKSRITRIVSYNDNGKMKLAEVIFQVW